MARWHTWLTAPLIAAALTTTVGCGTEQPAAPHRIPKGDTTKAGPATTPGPPEPIPPGRAEHRPANPDDLNGDGYPELSFNLQYGKDAAHQRLAFTFGSADGLNPDIRARYDRPGLGLPPAKGEQPEPDPGNITAATTADLDGDGHAEILTLGPGPGDPTTVQPGSPSALPFISWGSPTGPKHNQRATPLKLPDDPSATASPHPPTPGDFNGDGHHDLAVLTPIGIVGNTAAIRVLYGPFTRAGAPTRTQTVRADGPSTDYGTLIADRIDPEHPHPTALLLRHGNDGEQSANTFFPAGPTGLASTGSPLRAGNSAAFGDFDGDGKRDLAVGDDSSRNDEPGNETEAATVDQAVSIYFGSRADRKPSDPLQINLKHIAGRLSAADTDADGHDELGTDTTSTGPVVLKLDRGGVTSRTPLRRTLPARVDGHPVRKDSRQARLHTSGDFNADGKDEFVLSWAPDDLTGESTGTHWWIAAPNGPGKAFTTTRYAKDPAPNGN